MKKSISLIFASNYTINSWNGSFNHHNYSVINTVFESDFEESSLINNVLQLCVKHPKLWLTDGFD